MTNKDLVSLLSSISSIVPRPASEGFDSLCEAWCRFSGADWSWLWLRNEISQRFELAGRYPRHGELPKYELSPDSRSASEYCLRTREFLRISDVEIWSEQLGGESYRVHYTEDLLRLGSRSYDTVPLLPNRDMPAADWSDPFRKLGVLTLHYRGRQPGWRLDRETLAVLGRLCWNFIVSSKRAELLALLVHLNEISSEHLGRSDPPERVRASYLERLLDVIRIQTHCEAVTVYYQELGDLHHVACVATTGLVSAETSAPIAQGSLLKYRRGEARIGECFATGDTIIKQRQSGVLEASDLDDPDEKAIEVGVDGQPLHGKPSLYAPLRDAGGILGAEGVVKCVGRRPQVFQHEGRGFDPFEVSVLRFINDQMARDLRTLAARILRERFVSAVRHDLGNPLTQIKNATEQLLEGGDQFSAKLREQVVRLNVSALLAMTWLGHLEYPDLRNPGRTVSLTAPHRVALRRDVITKVVQLLDYFARIQKEMSVVDCTEKDVEIMLIGDDELLSRALSNVVLNAIRYGREATKIEVELGVQGDFAMIEVRNIGVEIPEEDRELLFDAYFRSSDVATHYATGKGLGLWIARDSLERHGGSIELKETKPRTVFVLRIPMDLALDGDNDGEE